MNSSLLLNVILASGIAAAFGCGLKWNEKTQPEVFELKDAACVSGSNQTIKNFFKATAQDEQLIQAMDCYSGVIKSFQKRIRGDSVGSYTPDDIQKSINQFLKDSDFDLSPALVAEIMKIKVLLVGGSRFLVTEDELAQLSAVVSEIKPDIVGLNSLMPIVSGIESVELEQILSRNAHWQNALSKSQIELSEKIQKLVRVFKHDDLNYKFSELYNLILEVLKSNRTKPETIDKMRALKPLALKAAEVLIDQHQVLDLAGWGKLARVFAPAYISYRRIKLLNTKDTKETGFDKVSIERVIFDVKPALIDLIDAKPSRSISNGEIYELLTESQIAFTKQFLDKPEINKWIQKVLNLKTFHLLLEKLWTNLLNDPVQRIRDSRSTNALDRTAVSVAARELELLFRAQGHLQKLYSDLKMQGRVVTKAEIKNQMQAMIDNTENKYDIDDSVIAREILWMYQSDANLVFDENNYLKILDPSNVAEETPFQLSDIERSNFTRAAARLLIRSFANNLDNALLVKEISRDDVIAGWDAVKPVVFEFELVHPDNQSFITSRFREADLFLSSSNGDGIAQHSEIHDLVLHIFSGKKRSDTVKIDIVNRCMPGTDPESLKPKDTANEMCLREHYVASDHGFEFLPEYMKLKTLHTPDELSIYALNILKATGYAPNPEQKVLIEDLDLFPHVVQYIEMVYFKYDNNRDGILDKFEAVRAYPAYQKTIAEVLEKIGLDGIIGQPERRKGVFLYLLQHGRGPETPAETTALFKFINDTRDINTTDKWTINPNRISLSRLFGFLAEQFNKDQEE